MNIFKKVLLVVISLSLFGCVKGVNESLTLGEGQVRAESFETVNGSVTVGNKGKIDGDIELINGRVRLGDDVEVKGSIETINGKITMGHSVTTGSIATINGGITSKGNITIQGDAETINGAINFPEGGSVQGDVAAVNGFIYLDNIAVGQDVLNFNGGMHLENGTKVAGSVRMEKPESDSVIKIDFNDERDIPRVVIGKNVVVEGGLVFEREVKLFIHDSATIGSITGTEPEYYSSDAAPE